MKSFDRSRVAALQNDLNGMKKVPENYVVENEEEIEGETPAGAVKSTDFIKQTTVLLQKALATYESSLSQLVERAKGKMSEFAGKQSGMEASQEEMQQKIKQLQSDFDSASKQVEELVTRVGHLETSGRNEDQAAIQQLNSELVELSKSLEEKKAQAEQLSNTLGDISGRASAGIEEMLKHIDELENYSADLYEKYKKLHGAYEKLHAKSMAHRNIATPEHVKNYGKFDLLEHLSRAKSKDKNSMDW